MCGKHVTRGNIYHCDTGLLPFFVNMSSRRSENMGIVYRNVDCESFTPLVFFLLIYYYYCVNFASEDFTRGGGGGDLCNLYN